MVGFWRFKDWMTAENLIYESVEMADLRKFSVTKILVLYCILIAEILNLLNILQQGGSLTLLKLPKVLWALTFYRYSLKLIKYGFIIHVTYDLSPFIDGVKYSGSYILIYAMNIIFTFGGLL